MPGNLSHTQHRNTPGADDDLVEELYKRLYKKYVFAEARNLVQQRLASYRRSINTSASQSTRSGGIRHQLESSRTVTEQSENSRIGSRESALSPGRQSAEANSSANQQPAREITDSSPGWEAKHPQYADIDARLRSFSNWSAGDVQEPRVLAEAGFYFTGRDDRVRCFACDGGLCNWAREDVAWYEHAKWYGNCPYVKDCQRNPVVAAIIDTARTLDTVQSAPGPQHQHHYQHGQTQCDPASSQPPSEAVEEPPALAEAPALPDVLGSPADIASMQHENEEMRSSRMCKVCMDTVVGIIFLPCSHLVCCLDCGLQVDTCPLCRAQIKATARVHVYA